MKRLCAQALGKKNQGFVSECKAPQSEQQLSSIRRHWDPRGASFFHTPDEGAPGSSCVR